MTKGYHSIEWDGTSNEGNIAASGIYYYIMKANNFSERKTMTLLKWNKRYFFKNVMS